MPMPPSFAHAARQIFLQIAEHDMAQFADFSLASGAAGIGLFCSTLRHHCPELVEPTFIQALMEGIQRQVASADDFLPGFLGGLAGTAFAVERIAINSGATADALSSLNEDVDAWVLDSLEHDSSSRHHDFVLGLTGLGMYALSRTDHHARLRLFSAIFHKLLALSESDGNYRFWMSRAPYLTRSQQQYPAGCLDLGVAHGNSGVLAMLGLALRYGMVLPHLAETSRGLANWLLAHERAGNGGAYGFVVGDIHNSRDAWCYGDPGVALALMRCGQSLNDRGIFDRGGAIGLRAAQRSLNAGASDNAGICHGHAGLSILNGNMYGLYPHPLFAMASKNSATQIVRVVNASRHNEQALSLGLWNGLAGMGLGLIGCASPWLPFLAL